MTQWRTENWFFGVITQCCPICPDLGETYRGGSKAEQCQVPRETVWSNWNARRLSSGQNSAGRAPQLVGRELAFLLSRNPHSRFLMALNFAHSGLASHLSAHPTEISHVGSVGTFGTTRTAVGGHPAQSPSLYQILKPTHPGPTCIYVSTAGLQFFDQ